jgi:hypothetical protein
LLLHRGHRPYMTQTGALPPDFGAVQHRRCAAIIVCSTGIVGASLAGA